MKNTDCKKGSSMNILIKNVMLPESYGFGDQTVSVEICDRVFGYIGCKAPREDSVYDSVIDGGGDLLIPGLYNAHCHAAMTIFRGYGEDLPLDRWLNEKIFPAEDRLTSEAVCVGTELAVAEMIRGGIVSFSDMYMFEDIVGEVALSTGIKANLSRSIVSFDDGDPAKDHRVGESIELIRDFHGADDGRIRVDLSLHAEYTNTERMSRYVAEYAKEKGLGIQIHISETEKEHLEAMARRNGRTPTEFFCDCGLFDVPVTAAHCVWLSDHDMDIFAEKKVTAVHNPVSNLKLGSGVMPLRTMLDRGVRVALGTDGAASNNNLDILKEMQYAVLLAKGISRRPESVTAAELLPLATVNGAMAQGREGCGRIETGYRADAVLVSLDSLSNIPSYGMETTLLYSARSSDVRMTVVDGRILFRDGEYQTIDVEKLKYRAKDVIKHYFD